MNFQTLRAQIEKRDGNIETLFLCAYAIYYFYLFLGTTMFDTTWFALPYRLSVVLAMAVLVCRLLAFKKTEWKEYLLVLLILGCTGFYWLIRGDKAVLILGIFLVAAKDVSFKKITQISLVLGTGIMIVALIASQVGIVEDLVYFQRGTYRHALGISYTTDCAAHVLFLMMGYCCLKNGRLYWWQYPVFFVGTIVLYYITRARNNTICLLLLIVFTGIYQLYKKWGNVLIDKIMRGIATILVFSYEIGASVIFFLTVHFSWDSPWYVRMNEWLSGRLQMGLEAYKKYGVSLWGKVIPQIGAGRTTEQIGEYFFLDSSYISLLLEKGLIIFLLIGIIFLVIAIKNYKKNLYIVFIVALIAIQSVVEHHIIDISYNFMLFLVFAKLDFEKGEIAVEKQTMIKRFLNVFPI